MKHCIYLFLFTVSLLTNIAWSQAPARTLSLKEVIETAFANNLTVRQSGFTAEAAGVNAQQAKGNLVPRLGGNINHYLNQGRSIDPASNGYINQENTTANYSLNTDVTLFNGFLLINSLRRSQLTYAATKMEEQQAKDKLMLDVVLAYLQLLTNTDLLEQAKRQADVSRQQVERLVILNREGAVKPSDLSDLRGQYANDQLSLVNAQNALDQSRYTLAQLMNVPFDKTLTVMPVSADQFDTQYGNSPDSIYQAALEQLAVVKAADLRNQAQEKAVRAAKGNFYPSLGFGAGLVTNYSSLATDNNSRKIPYDNQLKNNYGTYVGASISIPILNNFRYRSQVALAKIDYKNTKAIAQTTRTQLHQNIEKDYFNMQASLDKYKILNDQSDAFAESFHAAEARFNAGVGSSVEYLTAKNNLDRARTNQIVSRYEYLLRIKILDYYQGKQLW
jgi:outer membrane protein